MGELTEFSDGKDRSCIMRIEPGSFLGTAAKGDNIKFGGHVLTLKSLTSFDISWDTA